MLVSIDIGIKNFSYCIITKKDIIVKWRKINLYTVCRYKKCKNDAEYIYKNKLLCKNHKNNDSKLLNYNYICKKLYKILDIELYNFNINHVIIENQICSNEKMKKISNFIFGYFIYNKIYNIKLVCPNLKYKLLDNSIINKKKDFHKICSKYIIGNNYINYQFNNSLKKDDLSDCYMQGYIYILIFSKNIDI